MSFFVLKTQAQNSLENSLGTWYMFNATHKLSNSVKLITNAHVRYFELVSKYQQEIYRLGLNYTFNETVNLTLGTVYSITDTSYKENLPDLFEYRFYQDLNIKDKWSSFIVKQRIRLAQRFRRQNFENITTHRIRYGLFISYPITKKLTTYTFNEIFIKFTTKYFGQNKTGFGFTHKISKQLKLKMGYMHTLFNNTKSHRLQLGIILKTNPIRI